MTVALPLEAPVHCVRRVVVMHVSLLLGEALVHVLQASGVPAVLSSPGSPISTADDLVLLDSEALAGCSPSTKSMLSRDDAPPVLLIGNARIALPLPTLVGRIGRGSTPADLLKVVEALMSGHGITVRDSDVRKRPATARRLSPRERAVLELLALGYSNEAVAEQLSISVHTVRTHLQSVLGKLGVANRAAALVAAHRSGEIGRGRHGVGGR